MQPLDRKFMKPFKQAYSEKCALWMRKNTALRKKCYWIKSMYIMDSNQYAIESVTYLLVLVVYFYKLIVYVHAFDSIAFLSQWNISVFSMAGATRHYFFVTYFKSHFNRFVFFQNMFISYMSLFRLLVEALTL